MSPSSIQNFLKVKEDQIIQTIQEKELENLYQQVVNEQLEKNELQNKIKTFSVKYLGITDGKIGILSRKMPMQKKYKNQEQKQFNKTKSVPYIKKQEVVIQNQAKPIKSEDTQSQDSLQNIPFPEIKKSNDKNIVQGSLRDIPQSVIVQQQNKDSYINQLSEIDKSKYIDSIKEQLIKQSQEDTQPQIQKVTIKNQKDLQQNIPFKPKINKNKIYKNIKSKVSQNVSGHRQSSQQDLLQFLSHKQIIRTNQQQNEKQIQTKIQDAYENFNKQHQLMPNPNQYNQYLVNKYARPKGLQSYKKLEFASESEKNYQDKYSKQNLEKIGLADRRKMLGNFSSQQGMLGSKIKPVILSPHNKRNQFMEKHIDNQYLNTQQMSQMRIYTSQANLRQNRQNQQTGLGDQNIQSQQRPQTNLFGFRQNKNLIRQEDQIQNKDIQNIEKVEQNIQSDLTFENFNQPVLTNKQIIQQLLNQNECLEVLDENQRKRMSEQELIDQFQLQRELNRTEGEKEELYIRFLKFKKQKQS